jgi:hypothetical protein
MKRKTSETNAAAVARAYVQKTLGCVFDRKRAYRLILIQDPRQESKTGNRIIFADLRLMSQVRHRFTLILEKVSGQWTVVTATFNSFISTGSVKQGSIRRFEISRPVAKKVKKVKAKAPAPTPSPATVEISTTATAFKREEGLVYAKVTKVSGDKDLIVEHRSGKRMVFIEQGQPFYGTNTCLGRPRVGQTAVRVGDTIAYRPDKSSAGNHVFVGLPKK